MLDDYLDKAIGDLDRLIDLTRHDIEDIKRANHPAMFQRIETKESTMQSFETYKSLIDRTIARRAEAHPDSDLEALLSPGSRERLDRMREKLEELHALNRRFARLVIAVGEFYDSLFSQIVPTESDGYHKKSAKAASLIEVRA